VAVINLDRVLWGNAALRCLLGLESVAELASCHIDDVVAPGFAGAGLERRRLLLQHGSSLRGAPVKLLRRDGREVCLTTDSEVIRYGPGSLGAVQLLREGDCSSAASTSAPLLSAEGESAASATTFPCLHAATFDALPLPAAIRNADGLVTTNRQCRHAFSGERDGSDPDLDAILHEDFAPIAEEVCRLAIEHGHRDLACRAKVVLPDGIVAYMTTEAEPVEFGGQRFVALFALGMEPA
jgi:hypothetical protein